MKKHVVLSQYCITDLDSRILAATEFILKPHLSFVFVTLHFILDHLAKFFFFLNCQLIVPSPCLSPHYFSFTSIVSWKSDGVTYWRNRIVIYNHGQVLLSVVSLDWRPLLDDLLLLRHHIWFVKQEWILAELVKINRGQKSLAILNDLADLLKARLLFLSSCLILLPAPTLYRLFELHLQLNLLSLPLQFSDVSHIFLVLKNSRLPYRLLIKCFVVVAFLRFWTCGRQAELRLFGLGRVVVLVVIGVQLGLEVQIDLSQLLLSFYDQLLSGREQHHSRELRCSLRGISLSWITFGCLGSLSLLALNLNKWKVSSNTYVPSLHDNLIKAGGMMLI